MTFSKVSEPFIANGREYYCVWVIGQDYNVTRAFWMYGGHAKYNNWAFMENNQTKLVFAVLTP